VHFYDRDLWVQEKTALEAIRLSCAIAEKGLEKIHSEGEGPLSRAWPEEKEGHALVEEESSQQQTLEGSRRRYTKGQESKRTSTRGEKNRARAPRELLQDIPQGSQLQEIQREPKREHGFLELREGKNRNIRGKKCRRGGIPSFESSREALRERTDSFVMNAGAARRGGGGGSDKKGAGDCADPYCRGPPTPRTPEGARV